MGHEGPSPSAPGERATADERGRRSPGPGRDQTGGDQTGGDQTGGDQTGGDQTGGAPAEATAATDTPSVAPGKGSAGPARLSTVAAPGTPVPRGRLVAFGAVCALCLIGATLVVLRAGGTGGDGLGLTDAESAGTDATVPPALLAGPHAVFVDTRVGPSFGMVAVADLRRPDDFATTGLRCERVDVGGDRGLCLSADRGAVTTYHLTVTDGRFQPLWRRDLPGLPSRARVSADGRRGALTTFVSGDSYLNPGTFATRTEILDLQAGTSFGDIEQFTARRDGQVFRNQDFNVWGVTFGADPDLFYATLGTGGSTYLVRGSLDRRELTVLRDGVECPSLSPDGTRLAFKKRLTGPLGRVTWQLSVLDLATLVDHPLAEARSVDDQAQWRDPDTVLYALPEADSGTPTKVTWAVPADGRGEPRVALRGATSLRTLG